MRIAGGDETVLIPTASKDDTVLKAVPAGVRKTGTAKPAALPRVGGRRMRGCWVNELAELVG